MHTEIQRKIDESAQQIEELKPLLSSQSSDLSSNYSQQQQQQQVEDEVTIGIEEMIKDYGDGPLLPECCRVPSTLRHLNEEAYTPKVVSIGPFHYGNGRLKDMERQKHKLFKRFTRKASLDDLVRFVKCLLPKVRASYSETIELASYSKTIELASYLETVELTERNLVELILIDAGFIIELFTSQTGEAKKDAKLSQPWLENSITNDLLLLENQLPFFFIEELFNKAFPHGHHGSSFIELTYEYFGAFNEQRLQHNPHVKIMHFTDLLRQFYLPKEKPERDSFTNDGSCILLYNANALQEAGIKLKANESKCLLDLKFSGDKLEIPKLCVDDFTELLFHNMIALEQCHYPYDAYITDYALMLDCLVDTYKDVDLLVHNKIVSSYLGDTQNVALLFNGLWKNVTQSDFNSEYRDICQRLNGYCQGRWHKMKATLRRDYCRTPWQIVASIAAIVLLLLTAVQAILSILEVVMD